MKLYSFNQPYNSIFAVTTMERESYPKDMYRCEECNKFIYPTPISPVLEWQPGSDRIGDFIWSLGRAFVFVTQKTKDVFEKEYDNLEYTQVKFSQNEKLKKPARITKRTKPMIWLPYEGPSIWQLKSTSWSQLNYNLSGLSIKSTCSTCSKVKINYKNSKRGQWVLNKTTWNGAPIFHVHEYSEMVFCVEEVKRFVEKSGFNNVTFKVEGEIPD